MKRSPLLIEIGCEEIPARMIQAAAGDLERRLAEILDRSGLEHGDTVSWGGSRRLAVRIDAVQARQEDREEQLTGPPAKVAFTADGKLTPAARGFAKKQGIDPEELRRVETERGSYVGFTRSVSGRSIGEVLQLELPGSVAGMSFPKAMRWGHGKHRWVRPVHWLLALHGKRVLPVSVLGVEGGRCSRGHRFLCAGQVEIPDVDDYAMVLERAKVLVDPQRRRGRIADELRQAAAKLHGELIDDPNLLEEVADLVEWPGVVAGRFDPAFLELPREVLVTTLRHHQKCFSLQSADGKLLPAFLAVANTDRDEAGHVRRGNEWVVRGRLDDARFFWDEDRKQLLESRAPKLAGLALHTEIGSYADKAGRMERLAGSLAECLGLKREQVQQCTRAARICKADLVTGTVGEFPELQGRVGGLLLKAEGEAVAVSRAVYSHYQPTGPDDPPPETIEGCVVALADKLDNVAQFVGIGQAPTGSRDPFGLRRATNGIFRILIERQLSLTLDQLCELGGSPEGSRGFLHERLIAFLREAGYSANEVLAVFRPRVDETDVYGWTLSDIVSRLKAIQRVRHREDFRQLVKLTERVDTILVRNAERIGGLERQRGSRAYREEESAAVELERRVNEGAPEFAAHSQSKRYPEVVELLASFIDPVERFFTEVLVVDEKNPAATRHRYDLLATLRNLLTRYFDIRELAGEANRRA